MSLTEAPVRLCCGQRHHGAVCPDGTVWCCVCFGHFTISELFVDEDGEVWDVCQDCHNREKSA